MFVFYFVNQAVRIDEDRANTRLSVMLPFLCTFSPVQMSQFVSAGNKTPQSFALSPLLLEILLVLELQCSVRELWCTMICTKDGRRCILDARLSVSGAYEDIQTT